MNKKIRILFLIWIVTTLLLYGCSIEEQENNGAGIVNDAEPTSIPDTAAETESIADSTSEPLLSTATESSEATSEPVSATTAETSEPTVETDTPTDIEYTIDIDTVVASNLRLPLFITHAGDNTDRLFIVEKVGLIKILENNSVLPDPFLDISNLVSRGSEQGLLGLAFDPEYEMNGYFYINYTDLGGNTQVARYQDSDQPNLANAESAVNLFGVAQPYANHNGGHIGFGPDGYLYIGLGDGGSANDPQMNGQDLSTPLGTLLRIKVMEDGTYQIPSSNPYVDRDDADARIWHWGLRNPWRFSFDRQNGDLYIGDVGQGAWEEIDFQPADSEGGLNYGWPCFEGTHDNDNRPPCDDPSIIETFIEPIAEYGHDVGQSVTGGYVYRGEDFSFLQGAYFYADYVSGRIWSIRMTGQDGQAWTDPKLELDSDITISSFGEDANGEIYVIDFAGGTIRRLTATPAE